MLLNLSLVSAILRCFALAEEGTSPYLSFKSRPDLSPPRLYVSISEGSVTPGYIFMAPYRIPSEQNAGLMYDSQGELVYSSFGATGAGDVHDFRPCQYDSNSHICWYEGLRRQGYARGHMGIFDNTLALIKQVRAQYGVANLDQHETHLSRDGKSAHVLIYNPEPYDLSPQNITTGQGWIQNCIFQKIDIETGDLQFQWSVAEHVPLSESYILPNSTEASLPCFLRAYIDDAWHLNAIDEQPETGHFLISARHTNTVYKVDGETGEIIWKLGGKDSTFEFEPGLNFSSQHDARWLSSNASTDIVSLFDNASNGFQRTADRSQGMIIKLDHNTNPPRATLLKSFPSPDAAPLSNSQGNLRFLTPDDWQNSHAFLGWGSNPYMTEHDASGRIIFQANVVAGDPDTQPMHYRVYKANFTSQPRDAPALYSYARSDSSNTHYWMSWNGATEVRQWRIYGKSECDDAWTVLDIIDKTGFETTYEADGYQQYALIEALDAVGQSLRNSTAKGCKTFVPARILAESCNEEGCPQVEEYVEADQAVELAEMRPSCANPSNFSVLSGVTDPFVTSNSNSSGNGNGTGNGSASEQGGDDENEAYRLMMKIGFAEVWMLTLLVFMAWTVLI